MATLESKSPDLYSVEHGPMQARIIDGGREQEVHLKPVLVDDNVSKHNPRRLIPAVMKDAGEDGVTQSRVEVVSVRPIGLEWLPASAVHAVAQARTGQEGSSTNGAKLVISPPQTHEKITPETQSE